jgi:hypothetical protein
VSDCIRCLQLHGRGCPASDGELNCIFCEDGEICPIARLLKKRKAAPAAAGATKIPTTTKRRARTLMAARSTTEEDDTMATSRVCSEQSCDRRLAPNNSSGKCKIHGDGEHRSRGAFHGVCSEPGCGAKLSATNKSGLCQQHGGSKGLHGKPPVAPSRAVPATAVAAVVHSAAANGGNGHAGNGHAGGGNGQAHPPINGYDVMLEERISRAMSLIPTSQRLAWIATWLNGEC